MRYKKRPPSSVDSIFLLLHCHAFFSQKSSYRLSTTHPRSLKAEERGLKLTVPPSPDAQKHSHSAREVVPSRQTAQRSDAAS